VAEKQEIRKAEQAAPVRSNDESNHPNQIGAQPEMPD